jgi:ADP-heptose:LPS heptosyltransferase/glycosyltransferase involved in cell wall biosynthesis
MTKKRILFLGEATPLMTGFSTYWREVIRRINDTGDFTVAEYGSYMSTNDPRAEQLPWKFYGALPKVVRGANGKLGPDPRQDKAYKKEYKLNQFGKWKFNQVLSDFKPDYVCDIRDPWMVGWQHDTPLRENFKWVLMACIDGHPQKPEWVRMYENADAVFTYSHYGKKVLENQSSTIKVSGITSPGVDTDSFKIIDKKTAKEAVGFPTDSIVIGTVMRNQQRKLYPRLILSFKKLLKEWKTHYSKNSKVKKDKQKLPCLLLHTSVPDVGWDIPLEVKRNGLEDRVFYTFICHECDHYFVDNWRGEISKCPLCNKKAVKTPNTGKGLSNDRFASIYNSMDLYVQASVCEGYGMPLNEAKACGVPVLASEWSATEEQVKAPGGIPMKIAETFTDSGTMQRRSLFSEKDFIKKATMVLREWSPDRRTRTGEAGRSHVMDSWDKTSDIWINYFKKDQALDRSETWDRPIEIKPAAGQIPANIKSNKEEAIRWLYENVLNEEIHEEGVQDWLKTDRSIEEIDKFFRKKAASDNKVELLRSGEEEKIESVVQVLDPDDKERILYAMPETAGDVLLSTAAIAGIAKQHPDASIYFATNDKYMNILEGNPNIHKVIRYSSSVMDYRVAEGSNEEPGHFKMCFNPYILTQKIPHWLHNGYGKHLVDVYADMCAVEAGDVSISQKEPECEQLKDFDWGSDFITIHTGTSLEIKNHYNMQGLIKYCKVPVIHVGGKDDPPIAAFARAHKPESPLISLLGQTSPQELAWILARSKLHIGMDSFPGHVAAAVETDCVTLFGSTFDHNCIPRPHTVAGGICEILPKIPQKDPYVLIGKSLSMAINPSSRGECIKPCHLAKCTKPKKCIDNIKIYDDVIERLLDSAWAEKKGWPALFTRADDVKISTYCIILNGINMDLPIAEVISNHLGFSDEFVMVDGGSDDGTWELLQDLKNHWGDRLVLDQNPWDYTKPNMMGIQKTFARRLCSGEYLWQTDCDEMVPEWQYPAIQTLVRNDPTSVLFDLPCITFHGGMKTTGAKENCYKWRFSKNLSNIIHDVPIQFRKYNDGELYFEREKSDSCEYIWKDTGHLVRTTIVWDRRLYVMNAHFRADSPMTYSNKKEYSEMLSNCCNTTDIPCVFHYSWVDYARKASMENFWKKQVRYHEDTGTSSRKTGKWVKKPIDSITQEDIDAVETRFYAEEVLFIDVKKHPKDIVDWAAGKKWNQHLAFTE